MIGLAAYSGLLRTVKTMIAAGAQVNLRDNRGRTVLFDAVEQGHLSVAKELLRAGAKTDLRDSCGTTPAEALEQQEESPEMGLTALRIAHGTKFANGQLDAQAVAWRRRQARMLALLEQHGRTGQPK